MLENNKQWKSPFFFIQGADTQLGSIGKYSDKIPDSNWEEEIRLTTKAIQIANSMNPKPKFFVVCGDLVDALPGEKYKEEQIKDFKKCFRDFNNDIPLVCVCGNHDVGDNPTNESVSDYKSKFGDDYFAFCCGGVLFIVLNSQFYKNKQFVQDLASAQDEWLDKVIKNAKNYKHVVVFQHIPWFLRHHEEDDDEYFNIEKTLRKKMLDKFYNVGVRYIFCGHWHRNGGGKYNDLEVVVTSAIGEQLGNDKSGFRIVQVFEDSIQHKYYSLDDVPLNNNI